MTQTGGHRFRKTAGFIFGMSMLTLGANLVWIAYNSVLLPTIIERMEFRSPGLVLGLAGFFGMLLAIVASIWAGIVTDHGVHRLGRRTPAILLGAAASFPMIVLPILILAPSDGWNLIPYALPIVLLSFCGMQFFTNIAAGAWAPLLVDLFPERRRGTVSGVQGFLSLAGAAIGIVLVTCLNQAGATGAALWLIAVVFLLTAIQSAWTIHGRDRPARSGERVGLGRAFCAMFTVRTRVVVFFWMVLAVLLAFVGVNSLQLFGRFALQAYFPQIDPDTSFRTLGVINLAMTMLSAVGSGILSDRIGRRTLILGGMIFCAITSFLMGLTDDYPAFLLLAAIRSVATGPLVAIVPALAGDLAPKDETGQYMAYQNLTTALSGSLASLVFGLILVNLNRTSFTHVFFVSGLFFLAGSILFHFKVTSATLETVLSARRSVLHKTSAVEPVPAVASGPAKRKR
jgi:MFS family permease